MNIENVSPLFHFVLKERKKGKEREGGKKESVEAGFLNVKLNSNDPVRMVARVLS